MKCILPWINFGTNTFGRPRVCGYSDLESSWKEILPTWPPSQDLIDNYKLENSTIAKEWNSEYFKNVRKSFLKNEWPKNCSRCKYVEEQGGISKRMNENHMWYDTYNHLIEETNKNGSVNYQPPHIDVRTGTVCNFKCIHCSPAASSKWLEDRDIVAKYGYDYNTIDNKWISQESSFWDNLDVSQIKRYNFLGGESFYNKRHNEFIKKLNESKFAKDVEVMYVSNGSLLTKDKLNDLKNFKKIKLRLSIDVLGEAGEYFRYGLNWNDWYNKCKFIDNFIDTFQNFDVAFQWTCSNVSMFYLLDTYEYVREEFKNIRFLFENHVTTPYHMSVQNLPLELKNKIKRDIESYHFKERDKKKHIFYVNHMMDKNAWPKYGNTFKSFLDDIDKSRNISWKKSFSELVSYVD